MASLNLARQPFVNARPLQRICTLLTVLAVVLVLINGFLFWRYLSSSAGLRGQLRDIRAEIATEKGAIGELRSRVAGYDLRSQNDQAAFLNYQIRRRTFGWSLLFERLGEVLPNKVKISTLNPSIEGEERGRRGQTTQSGTVSLMIRGTSADGENLLDLVDRLFAHPAFDSPRLLSENRNDKGEIGFELSTSYLPSPTLGEVGDGSEESQASPNDTEPGPPTGEQYTDLGGQAPGSTLASGESRGTSTNPPDGGFATRSVDTRTQPRPAVTREAATSDSAPPGTQLRSPVDSDDAPAAQLDAQASAGQRRVRPQPRTRGSRFQPGRAQPTDSDSPVAQPRTTPTRSQPGIPGVPVLPTRNASSPGGGR